jgi:hypothetical protein
MCCRNGARRERSESGAIRNTAMRNKEYDEINAHKNIQRQSLKLGAIDGFIT